MKGDHTFRFGKNGKPLSGFFKQRKLRQERLFPLTVKAERMAAKRILRNGFALKAETLTIKTADYVERYYRYNRDLSLIAFVGC